MGNYIGLSQRIGCLHSWIAGWLLLLLLCCRYLLSGLSTKKGDPSHSWNGSPYQNGSDLLSHLGSTIGAVGLNFSVRNGKRWNPDAIATWISLMTIAQAKETNTPHNHTTQSIRPGRKETFGQLVMLGWTSLNAYTCILSTLSSTTTLRWDLILWPASHLDAFSAYPIQT